MENGSVVGSAIVHMTTMATTAITVMGPIIAMDRASASALAPVAGIFMVAIIAELPIVAEDPCAVRAKGLRNTFGRAVSRLEAAPLHRLEICGLRPSTRTLLLLTGFPGQIQLAQGEDYARRATCVIGDRRDGACRRAD
jgi:hypothetical protein